MEEKTSWRDFLQSQKMILEALLKLRYAHLSTHTRNSHGFFLGLLDKTLQLLVPKYVLYVLHCSIHEDAIFYWARIISNEVSFQLENFHKTKKFYMTSYLVYAIVYFHVFEDFPQSRNVNYNKDPVQFWYPSLWRHKAPYHFYQVQTAFLSTFKRMIHGSSTPRLSKEATTFLVGKGVFEVQDEFNYIRLYGFQGKPFLLPYYVYDKLFMVEVCKHYRSWAHFFNEKQKKKFIPLPLKLERLLSKTSLTWMNLLFILIISK
jgi:hypothetical protein